MQADNDIPGFSALSSVQAASQVILVVDDDFVNRMILQKVLERSGYEVPAAVNGKEAIAQVKAAKPDLILLDVMMPEMDGYEVCRQLKADPDTESIPVIFITALNDPDNLLKGFNVGAADYIYKPINVEEVRARVKTHLRLKAATEAIKRYNEELERVVAESSKELIRAERQAAVGQLIQGIVHNLKGPLTAMKGGLEIGRKILASMTSATEEGTAPSQAQLGTWSCEASKALELAASASGRLQEMINSLMEKGSVDHVQARLRCDLNEIILAELEFLSADRDFKHHIKKVVDLCPEKPVIVGNPSEIAQVLSNLLGNAKDALTGSSSPLITITTRINGPDILLTVTDNGPGIAAPDLERIFEPFYTTKARPEKDTKTSVGLTGTGLGLYMCLRSIRAMGGEMWAENSAGGGATFAVRIPLAGQED
ncbi:MAG: hybrid sensor histidine kinase/response regulator [Desulfurivibrionaceae bacterium]|jgi:signal transduction histidine kinase